MESGSSKILESIIHRTLHAHNFSRSSSQAAHVLTDLLARYLSLLTLTCAQFAQHAGRSTLSIHDILLSLEEVGVSTDELVGHYESDGKELARYAFSTVRRAEELSEMRVLLQEGLKKSRDDAIQLVYARMSSLSPLTSEDEDDEGSIDEFTPVINDDSFADEVPSKVTDVMDVDLNGDVNVRRPSSPPLPLSPISNPSTPPRKRPRLSNWRAPSHIPDFLPPYPSHSLPPSPRAPTEVDLPPTPQPVEPERPLTPPPQLSTSTSTSDYLTPVPYSMSSISNVPEWHLPRPHSPISTPSQSNSSIPGLETNRTIVHAYHHVLTNPPPSIPTANPARHKLAMAMLGQMYTNPRWTPPDTLFSSVNPPPPSVVAPPPSWPKPLVEAALAEDPAAADKIKKLLLPPPISRPIVGNEMITHISNEATSRIPDLTRQILPPGVYNRATRLQPPPVFVRSNEKLFYGMGVPASWNDANQKTQPRAPNIPGKKSKDTIPNGKVNEHKNIQTGAGDKVDVVDAMLYATWDWDRKDYRVPLPPGKRMRQTINFPGNAGTRPGISIVTGPGGSNSGRAKGSGKKG